MTAGPAHRPSSIGESREPTATEPMRPRRLNRWQVVSLQGDLADLSMDSAVARPTGEGFRGEIREGLLERLAGALGQPGFALVIAETTGLAGRLTGSEGAFAFTRIPVRPHPRDADMARRQDQLLTGHQAPLGVTLVDRADRSALPALRSWGWNNIGDVRRPTDDTVFLSLVLALGERTTGMLEGLDYHARPRGSA
ncbi:hypothetical protein ACIO93_21020 [Streptomyces sp. NPDC087903]|uniref:hypothetical protein n=1 Tax=Streptomyces sp. NPDC087903 TaxID=3365819 RepID=UPI00381FF4E4